MRRADYKAIAKTLRERGHSENVVWAFVDVLKRTFPNFDSDKFLAEVHRSCL
jgi:sirohydrochlorin ferrochelatase